MMTQQEMIQSLRAEIAKLQRVVDLLIDQPRVAEEVRRPGRPKGSGTRATGFNPEEFVPKRRTMSAEGRARIAAAQKKRWIEQRGLGAGRSALREAAATKRTGKKLESKSAAKKSWMAAKNAGSTQANSRSASAKRKAVPAKKSAGKSATKGSRKLATKRPAKQAVTVALEA